MGILWSWLRAEIKTGRGILRFQRSNVNVMRFSNKKIYNFHRDKTPRNANNAPIYLVEEVNNSHCWHNARRLKVCINNARCLSR